jgi:hypothetical protein
MQRLCFNKEGEFEGHMHLQRSQPYVEPPPKPPKGKRGWIVPAPQTPPQTMDPRDLLVPQAQAPKSGLDQFHGTAWLIAGQPPPADPKLRPWCDECRDTLIECDNEGPPCLNCIVNGTICNKDNWPLKHPRPKCERCTSQDRYCDRNYDKGCASCLNAEPGKGGSQGRPPPECKYDPNKKGYSRRERETKPQKD